MKRALFCLVIGAMALAASGARAEMPSWQDWSVGAADDGSGAFAATANESGSVFLQSCSFEGSCEYRLITSKACEVDATYPGLVSSEIGATSVTLVCRGDMQNGDYVLAVAPFTDVDTLARKSTRLGIVIPTQSDRFHVMRFSMMGATAAVTFMRDAVSSRLDAAPASRNLRAPRDTTL